MWLERGVFNACPLSYKAVWYAGNVGSFNSKNFQNMSEYQLPILALSAARRVQVCTGGLHLWTPKLWPDSGLENWTSSRGKNSDILVQTLHRSGVS